VKEEKATERLQQQLKRLQQRTAELEQAESEHKQAEKALEERANQLQIIGEVSRKVSSILNLDELLSYVIKAIQESFGYYHVDIFLIDQDQGYALFKASSNPTVEKVWKEQKLRFKLGEEGMIGWVSQSGEPLLANDVTKEPLYLPNKSLPETKSELVVPLKVEEQTFGVLDVQSSELDAFNVDDIFVLETLGNQVAIAIENARLHKESQRRTEEMTALREVTLATLSTLDRDQVFQIMLDQLDKFIDYVSASIKVITPDGREKIIAGRGPIIHEQIMWDGFDVKENKLIQEMRETRQPVVVHDTHTDERYQRVGNWEVFHSWIGSPLFVRGDLIGHLDVEMTSPFFYDENAVRLLGDFARAAAIALENARLFEAVSQELAERKKVEEALQESEARYRAIFENAPFGIWISDEEGTLRFANQATLNLFGVTDPTQLIGHWNVFRDTTEAEEPFRTNFERAQTGEVVRFRQDLDMRTVKYGTTRKGTVHFYLTLFPIRAGSSQHSHIVVIQEDITEQVRAEEEIYQLGQFRNSIIDNANVWLDVLDEKRNVLIWNKAAETISGYSRGEVVGNDRIWEWLYPDEAYRKELIEKVTAVVEKGEVREGLETTIRCKDGQTKIISWHERNLLDREGKTIGSIALGRDITERKRAEKQLAYMATHDPLTDLPNRQAFNDRLKLELTHAHRNRQKLAVMMLDLDYFKDVNDTLGHSVGDQLLQAVGHRLTSIQRKSDTVARLGGDEFMLILPGIAQAKVAEEIAQKVLEAVRQPFAADGHELHITTSIGMVIYPEDAEDGETLVKNADIAMYRSKEMGRDNYQCYTLDMEPKTSE